MSLGRNWQLRIRNKAAKRLKRFPRKDRERILSALEGLPRNPFAGDIEKMKGETYSWRRRIGSYRIFYEIIGDDKIIYIFHIERRTSKTY